MKPMLLRHDIFYLVDDLEYILFDQAQFVKTTYNSRDDTTVFIELKIWLHIFRENSILIH